MATIDEFPSLFIPDSNGKMPWEYPSWNYDWEIEYLDKGYKTLQEWNFEGRTIAHGEKGKRLPYFRKTVFRIDQTRPTKNTKVEITSLNAISIAQELVEIKEKIYLLEKKERELKIKLKDYMPKKSFISLGDDCFVERKQIMKKPTLNLKTVFEYIANQYGIKYVKELKYLAKTCSTKDSHIVVKINKKQLDKFAESTMSNND